MVYGVGQSDNILDSPNVAMPKYTIGSLSKHQYPCDYKYPDMSSYPEQIPLGSYDSRNVAYPPGYDAVKEPYVKDTQHRSAGEFTDIELFAIVALLLVITVAFLVFQFKQDIKI